MEPNKLYNWKRFWCPREGKINLSDGGYLYDPDSQWGNIYNPDVLPFEQISKKPCLVLLGEPGIGKTSAMQQERKSIEETIQREGGQSFWLDLRQFSSEERLVQRLFQNPIVTTWKYGDYILHVFLDSLDECLLRIDTLAALLGEELKLLPIERLKFHIACRTADWPSTLENSLVSLWGPDAVGVYELTPIRRKDVIEATRARNIDVEIFLNEINRMEAVPLAIKPVTLNFLLNIFKKTGEFPHTKRELYSKGCELLCEESSMSRRDAKLTGNLDSRQRLIIAARIAAITVFSNKFAIWTSIDRGDVPEEDVTIAELCGKTEVSDDSRFLVDNDSIVETLSTGLFSSRGQNRMGWAHQTYAEFLAAHYLIQRELKIAQINSLIFHSGDAGGKIIPQLNQVSAWLASMNQVVFSNVVRANPAVLLRSDLTTTDSKYRIMLVDSLLQAFENEEILERNNDVIDNYWKLKYEGLELKLGTYINDKNKGLFSRRCAIDIAKRCEIRELQEDIISVMLDPLQPLPIRVEAAYCIVKIADGETKKKLKDFLSQDNTDDIDDELKGCALRALWPDDITAKELFSIIDEPKRENFVGAYYMFLSREVVKHLGILDLPMALNWVEKQGKRHQINHAIERLMDGIMIKSWEELDSPEILNHFARVALFRIKHHDDIIKNHSGKDTNFKTELFENDEKRRKVLCEMIPMLKNIKEDFWQLIHSVAYNKDVLWMIEQLRKSASEDQQLVWALLIERLFDINDIEHVEKILKYCQTNKILADEMKGYIEPITLGSPAAEEMKNRHYKIKRMMKNKDEKPLLDPPPDERIEGLLKECEGGNYAAWWHLNMELTLELDSTSYGDEMEYDITVLPGWISADEITRLRIINTAKGYLLNHHCKKDEWIEKNVFYRPAVAGYRALCLLLKNDPNWIKNLNRDVWKKWAPILLDRASEDYARNEDHEHRLLVMAYEHAPLEIINGMIQIINKENKESGSIYITRKVERIWDESIEKALLLKLKDKELKDASFGVLLGNLLDHDVTAAKDAASSLLNEFSTKSTQRDKAVITARKLMAHSNDGGWPIIWPIIQNDIDFGREVIEGYSHHDRRSGGVWKILTEKELSEFFIWLVEQYPYVEETRKISGDGWIGPRDSASELKRLVLEELKLRGTPDSCDAIKHIIDTFPEFNWLNWTLLEAKDYMRRKTWVPPKPKELIDLVSNNEIRLVQNGDDLIAVLIESLKRLEEKFQGETPAAIDLWNNIDNKYTPKDEESFSNYVKRYLQEDIGRRGIIVNREVEIRRGEGAGQGEGTDIHVDAVVKITNRVTYDMVKTIIEVKGCWHKKLKTGMKKQLVDRYLKDNPCQYGIYLVGWFICEQWDEGDYRKGDTGKWSLEDARQKFKEQAMELSQNGLKIEAFVMNCALR